MSDQPPMPPPGSTPSGPYSPGGYGGLGGYSAPATKANGLGTASLVLGILSIVPFWELVIPGILAVVFGVIGRRRAGRGEADNGGVALAGLITGVVGLLIAAAIYGVLIAALVGGRCHSVTDTSNGQTIHSASCS